MFTISCFYFICVLAKELVKTWAPVSLGGYHQCDSVMYLKMKMTKIIYIKYKKPFFSLESQDPRSFYPQSALKVENKFYYILLTFSKIWKSALKKIKFLDIGFYCTFSKDREVVHKVTISFMWNAVMFHYIGRSQIILLTCLSLFWPNICSFYVKVLWLKKDSAAMCVLEYFWFAMRVLIFPTLIN